MGLSETDFQQLLENQRRAGNGTVETPQAVGAAPDDRPESKIELECVKFMEADGWRALKTDPVSRRGHGKGFGEIGMADVLFIQYSYKPEASAYLRSYCRLLWVEFKARGGKPKSHQLDWHNKERARGALTVIASVDFTASVSGFQEWYEKSGLMRRERWW